MEKLFVNIELTEAQLKSQNIDIQKIDPVQYEENIRMHAGNIAANKPFWFAKLVSSAKSLLGDKPDLKVVIDDVGIETNSEGMVCTAVYNCYDIISLLNPEKLTQDYDDKLWWGRRCVV